MDPSNTNLHVLEGFGFGLWTHPSMTNLAWFQAFLDRLTDQLLHVDTLKTRKKELGYNEMFSLLVDNIRRVRSLYIRPFDVGEKYHQLRSLHAPRLQLLKVSEGISCSLGADEVPAKPIKPSTMPSLRQLHLDSSSLHTWIALLPPSLPTVTDITLVDLEILSLDITGASARSVLLYFKQSSFIRDLECFGAFLTLSDRDECCLRKILSSPQSLETIVVDNLSSDTDLFQDDLWLDLFVIWLELRIQVGLALETLVLRIPSNACREEDLDRLREVVPNVVVEEYRIPVEDYVIKESDLWFLMVVTTGGFCS
ncbi:hypothetical protein AX16_004869 [Volvariella volvacea WC 439]|nr:hypothetical protein AX16_004869 [Volvariella volvacea WC 439]